MSSLTQAAGIAAIAHTNEAMTALDAIRTQRDRIDRELRAIEGITVYPSDANFVLFVPRGEPESPLSWDELEQKFDELVDGVLGREDRDALVAAVRGLSGLDELGALSEPLRAAGRVGHAALR